MFNIAIADDHLLFSQSLKQLLETQKDFNVVGIGNNGLELLDIVHRTPVHLAIVDLRMPKLDGMATSKKLRADFPDLKIVILSMFNETHTGIELKKIGVHGYISKAIDNIGFISAIHAIRNEAILFPADLEKKKNIHKSKNTNEQLTGRETEIVRLISLGHTSRTIASQLFISTNTVKEHRKHILRKLNLNNIQELVAYAIAHGLHDLTP